MNKRVNALVQYHLVEYANEIPLHPLMYDVYVSTLHDIYTRRYMVTWLHILLGAWAVINVGLGIAGLWFAWLPLIVMAFLAVLFRMITAE